MTVPPFVAPILRWRDGVANIADKDSATSKNIAAHMFGVAACTDTSPLHGNTAGRMLEEGVRDYLLELLETRAPERAWVVDRKHVVTDFLQYAHLAKLQQLINEDASGTLGVQIGRDYLVRPDVTVGLEVDGLPLPFLHAAVSCKWTIRSDRVQNIRHEGVILTRHRRGRAPHLVTVTPEPLPTRIAAIARGTGEVDAVYHVMFNELVAATEDVGTAEQKGTLHELIEQNRLFDFNDLPGVLLI